MEYSGYSIKDIGKELKKQLDLGYDVKNSNDVERVSDWAFDMMILTQRNPLKDVYDILYTLTLMGAGPEFVYTHEELQSFAETMIKEGKNPFPPF